MQSSDIPEPETAQERYLYRKWIQQGQVDLSLLNLERYTDLVLHRIVQSNTYKGHQNALAKAAEEIMYARYWESQEGIDEGPDFPEEGSVSQRMRAQDAEMYDKMVESTIDW